MKKNYVITLIGGGTGSFTLLKGLKNYPNIKINSIVTMSDDGGSTGILRDEYGVLPPGDIRQNLVALSESDEIWRKLFSYRYKEGILEGQNFGNIFLSTLEKITGSFEKAISLAEKILEVKKGKIIPVTLENVRLKAETIKGKIIEREKNIDLKEEKIKRIFFDKEVEANEKAIKTILESDLIVFSPGDLYTSLLPNLIVKGIKEAIKNSRAKKVYVCNIMTQKNHTDNYKVTDFIKKIEEYTYKDIFDYIIYNTKKPKKEFLEYYSNEGEKIVKIDEENFKSFKARFIGEELISEKIPKKVEGDKIIRALIRHDSYKTASIIYEILKEVEEQKNEKKKTEKKNNKKTKKEKKIRKEKNKIKKQKNTVEKKITKEKEKKTKNNNTKKIMLRKIK